MPQIQVHYYFDDRSFYFDDFDSNLTIKDFLQKVDKKKDKYVKSVFLRGKRLFEMDTLGEYIKDLQYNALFISWDGTKEIIINQEKRDLKDFKKIEKGVYSNANFKDEISDTYVFLQQFKINKNQHSNFVRGIYIQGSFSMITVDKIFGYKFSAEEKFIASYSYYEGFYPTAFDRLELNEHKGSIIYSVAFAMKQMHDRNIIFRNLNLNNILISDDHGTALATITNFQYAKFISDTNIPNNPIDSDNLYYLTPPERTEEKDSFKMDVFSYAIFLYEILSDKRLFDSKNRAEMVQKFRRGERPNKPTNISQDCWNLIEQCWNQQPEQRPTFGEILTKLEDVDLFYNDLDPNEENDYYSKYSHLMDIKEYLIRENQIEEDLKLEIQQLNSDIKYLRKEIVDLQGKNDNLEEKIKKFQEKNQFNILDSETIRNFRTIREISFGASGKVLEVAKEEKYALKVMHAGDHEIKDYRAFIAEYEKINLLQHPNIIQTYGIFMSDEKNPPSILLEYCTTDLKNAFKNKTHSHVEVVIWIYQIVEGMKYVQKCELIHRDLKPSNILIAKDGKIRITDFGISKLMSAEEQSSTFGVGTQKFMAPEILKEEDYNEKADVYSFGVVIYFMISGGEMPKINIIQVGNGKKAVIPSSFAPFAKELINNCWNYKAKDRPSFDEILSLLKNNEYKLFNLNDSEIDEVKKFVVQHKKSIPSL